MQIAQRLSVTPKRWWQATKAATFDVVFGKLTELGMLHEVDPEGSLEQLLPPTSQPDDIPVVEEVAEVKTPENVQSSPGSNSAGSDSALSAAKLKVRLTRLKMERDAKERQDALQIKRLELEFENEQKAREFDNIQRGREYELRLRELEIRKLELQRENVPVSPPVHGTPPLSPFEERADVSRLVSLPTFKETEVDAFFSTFERLATTLKWPEEVWTALIQGKLCGKAQDVVASLSLTDSQDYQKVKTAVLRAYELVPEAYRQQFRDFRKNSGQTYVEFARERSEV